MELKKSFYYPILLFAIIFVSLFFILGIFSWPMPGDDYGAVVGVRQSGFWAMQVNMYLGWQGRVLNTFIWGFLSLFPMEKLYKVLSFIIIMTYAICAWFFVNNLFETSSKKNKILTTAIMTACTLAFTYYLHETVYSINACLYFGCTSFILLATALAVKALRGSRAALWGCVVVIVLNGTVYEHPCIFQGVVAFFAMIYFAAVKDKSRAKICCIFWLAALASFCIMYFAPGTAIRMRVTAKGALGLRIWNAAVVAGTHGLFTTMQFFVKPLVYVFLLFMPIIAKKIPAAKIKLKSWQIVIATALITPLMQVLHGWTMGTGLPERGISVTLWFMLFVWCLLWSFFYRGKLTESQTFANFARRWRYPILIFALLISANFVDVVKSLKLGPAYLAENKARVQSIEDQKAAGLENVVIPRLKNRPPLIFEDLNINADKGAFAKYYGVKSVLAIPPELINDPEAIKEIQNDNLTPLTQVEISDPWVLYWLGYDSDPIYRSSLGIEVSIEAAKHWHRLAADKGHPRSMRALSRLIYTEDKSLSGILRALYWYAKSQFAWIRL